MRRYYWLGILWLGSCVQPAPTESTEPLDWDGSYGFDSAGYGAILVLNEDGRFDFDSVVCTGMAQRASGHWQVSGNQVILSTSITFIGMEEVGSLQAIAECQDRYLIPEGIMGRMYEGGWPPPWAGFTRGGYKRKMEIEESYREQDYSGPWRCVGCLTSRCSGRAAERQSR